MALLISHGIFDSLRQESITLSLLNLITHYFLHMAKSVFRVKQKHFKFANAWLKELGCKGIVQNSWPTNISLGIQMKIEACGKALLD